MKNKIHKVWQTFVHHTKSDVNFKDFKENFEVLKESHPLVRKIYKNASQGGFQKVKMGRPFSVAISHKLTTNHVIPAAL